MKKIMIIALFAAALVFTAAPVTALPYSYAEPIDSIVAMGVGSPDEVAEKGYLADYLGISGTAAEKAAAVDALYSFEKNEAITSHDYKDLAFGFDPGFAWDFAIVKVDGPLDYWYLFMDDNGVTPLNLADGDNVLTTPAYGTEPFNTGTPPKGISHVSWFRTETNSVPEPTTLFLLGLGLIGLAGIRRK